MKKLFIIFLSCFLIINISNGEEKSLGLDENIFQESVNKYFKIVDKEVLDYLINLQKSKNYCFGPQKNKTFVECIDDISKDFSITGKFGEKYDEACSKSLEDTINKQEGKRIASKDSTIILDKNLLGTCNDLYRTKLLISKNISTRILKKNKYAILKDEFKKYRKKGMGKYEKLYNLILAVEGLAKRMKNKWPSKTP